MKTSLLIATFATIALQGNTAIAADNTDRKLEVQQIPAIEVQASRLTRETVRAFRGVYRMDDGTSVRLYQDGLRAVVEIGTQAPIEVRASSATTLVAVAGTTTLRFRQSENGLNADVVLTREVGRG